MKVHRFLFSLFLLSLPTQLGRHFWPNWSLVWGLRVDYLSPTLYLADILLGLTLASLAVSLAFSHELRITRRSLCLYISIFLYLYIIISSFFPYLFLYKFAQLVKLGLLAAYVAHTTKTRADFARIVFFLTLGAAFESGLALAQFLRQSSLGGIFWWLGERTFNQTTPGIAQVILNHQLLLRPYATFPHPNALAGYLLVILILNLNFKTFVYSLKFAFYSLLFACFILTFSRSAWLVGLVIFSLFLLAKRPKFNLFVYLLICLLICLFVAFAYLFIGGDAAGLQKRWELTLAALTMIKSSPLFGVGLGHFIPTLATFPQTHSTLWLQPVHNIYLLIAAESGLIGLGIFLGLIFKTYQNLISKQTLKNSKSKVQMSNQIQNSKLKFRFGILSFICHLDFEIWSLSAILLTGLADHYWFTLQQNQLLFAVVLGLCWSHPADSNLTRKVRKTRSCGNDSFSGKIGESNADVAQW